ncbi:unnamed protein product [Haemonchus placei]|uniref:C2H2-type domain-containing protein n=1 Tax=Haemonchus placei TaxID=6290 RepID=A0A0N4X0D6_HAEPC|nr:unnamed protein product [Haemonchus placei]
MAMYLKNNERRLPTELQHHLCFICGTLFREKHEYQKHLIGHQSFALVYQIYNFDKSESERKANEKAKKPDQKPGRVGHAVSDDYPKNKGYSSLRQSEELEKEMRYRAKGRPRVDKLEKVHREERRQYLREKEREEELLAERERQRKIEAARKRRETRKRKLDEHAAMTAMRDQAMPIAKRKLSSRDRGIDSTPLVSPAALDEPCSSSPPEPPPPPKIILPRETASGFSIGPLLEEKCPYCETGEPYEHPVEAIEHIVDHGGSVLDVKLHFYEDDKFIATETQLTGEKCNVCDVTFDFPTQYYLHLLSKHRMDVTTYYRRTNHLSANNVKITTVIIYRMYPEHTVEFREIIPVEEVEGEKKES